VTFTIFKWSTRVLVFGALLVLTAASWLIATEAGTRWLYAKVDRWIPDALAIEGLGGTLFTGLTAQRVRWEQPGFVLAALNVALDVDIPAAMRLAVGIDSMHVDQVRVELGPTGEDTSAEPFGGFESPLPIGIDNGVFDDIEIRLPDNSIRIKRLDVSARLSGSRLRIDRVAIASDWLTTRLSGEVTLTPPIPINLEAQWSGVTLADRSFAGRIAAIGNASEIRLRHRLQSPFELSTDGSLTLGDAGWNVDLENRWNRIEWSLPSGQHIESRDGRLHARGNVADYRAEGEFWARFDEWPEAKVTAAGGGDLLQFVFDTLEVESTAGRAGIAGRLAWSPDLDWDANFEAAQLDTSLLLADMTGTINARGQSSGRFSDGEIVHLALRLDDLEGELLSLPARASGDVTYAARRLDVAAASLMLGSSRATVSGQAGDNLDLEFTVDMPDVGELLAEASGRVAANGRVGGTRVAPSIVATAQGSSLGWRNYSAAESEARVDLASDRRFALSAGGTGLGDGQRTVDRWTVSANGRPESHRIEIAASGATGEARIVGSGGYADAAWAGQLDAFEVGGQGIGRWASDRPAKLRASASATRLDLLCLDRQDLQGRACIELGYEPDQPFDFAVSIAELPVAALPFAPPAGVGITGNIFVEASGEIAPETIDASASVEVRNASVSAEIEGETETVHFTRLAGNAGIEANRLDSVFDVAFSEGAGIGHIELAMADVRSAESAIGGLARVNISDLALVELFVPSISQPSGSLQGEVAIAGLAKAPSLSGRIELSDGRIGVPAAGTEVHDIHLALEQREPGSLAISGSAESGKGRVGIEGRTTVDPATGLETDIVITGEDFELLQLPDMQASASPDVRIHVDTDEVTVRGRLLIPSSSITVQSIPEGARKPSPDAIVQGRVEATGGNGRRASVDIDVTLGDDVSFAGFGLTTDLTGNLRVQAAPSSPVTGLGRISLIGGRYEAYGQDLEIERGELIFSGPINNPLLDLRAVRRLPDVTAGIHVTGTPNELSSEVFSDPAMSDVEALSYLLTGHALASADMGEGDLMNKAAFALGMSQAGAITSQVRSSLGLETLTLQGGVDDSRIVAGKRIGGRLLVEYGYGLVDQLGTLILKYQVNERLILESSTGSVSTLDIIYKVRRK